MGTTVSLNWKKEEGIVNHWQGNSDQPMCCSSSRKDRAVSA